MDPRVERLSRRIAERGWRWSAVPIGRLADLERAIRGLFEDGSLFAPLYRERLGFLSFALPADLPGARSILVVAVPTPPMRLHFHGRGGRVPVVVPPTYVSYTRRTEETQAVLAGWLAAEGLRLAKPRLPLKTLAVRSGLAEYGRNNIAYVPGMGSFLQLVGAFSDLPCEADPWREPKALERCDSCVTCVRRCPTGAIAEDRFLIRAERCLTYHNEAAADFPDWIDPAWHHCLVGCMRCQSVCPENRTVRGWCEDRAEFSERETALLLARTSLEELPEATAAKLRALEINEDHRQLCRNLAMVLEPPARAG